MAAEIRYGMPSQAPPKFTPQRKAHDITGPAKSEPRVSIRAKALYNVPIIVGSVKELIRLRAKVPNPDPMVYIAIPIFSNSNN